VISDNLNVDQNQAQPSLSELLSALRQFKGITRKSALGELLPILGENVYDDAGALELGDVKVVVSADGIVDSLVRDDPWLAGFYSVVVNVNDVIAKGARPLGYVHVLSSSSPGTRRQIVQGIKQGIDKYGLKFLKGHTHPDTSYDAIDSAVIGVAHNFLSSATAKPNDAIIVAVDLEGNSSLKGWVKTFDSVLFKTSKQVLTRLEAIIELADEKLVHSCRDVSGPGIVGTVVMLCESSHVGASITLDDIPKPEHLAMQEWLMSYPTTGFVFTTDKPQECIKLLIKHGLTASAVGTISEKRAVQISHLGQVKTFFNLEKESIFGLKKENAAVAQAEKVDVKELSEMDAHPIEVLLKKVWPTAYEYPEEWRNKRMLTEEQILREMKGGYHYFGIKVDGKLAGFYKASITEEGLFGEHQTVDADFRGLGLATAMYRQFIGFAKENDCKKVYLNSLTSQIASKKILEKMGFVKKGQEYEQAKGMMVQMYELDCEVAV